MGKVSELHRIQQSFRSVLEAVSRPGKVMKMKCPKEDHYDHMGVHSSLGTLIDMFVDQAVSFSTFGSGAERLENAISIETHSSANTAETAAFLIGKTKDTEALRAAFEKASGGTPDSPHKGATFLIECDRLSAEEESAYDESRKEEPLYWVSVEGPGVETRHVFGVSDHEWVWSRERRNDEYPCGIEIILTDREGRVVAIPRSSFVSLLVVEGDKDTWAM